jgi:hypothetical protein
MRAHSPHVTQKTRVNPKTLPFLFYGEVKHWKKMGLSGLLNGKMKLKQKRWLPRWVSFFISQTHQLCSSLSKLLARYTDVQSKTI